MKTKKAFHKPERSTCLVVLLIVALLAASVLLQYSMNDMDEIRAGEDENAIDSAASSVLDLLGGIRETVAAVLWSKTHDIYHEYGVSEHSSVALFPYYWMIIKLDPHYVMAYYYTSWMLAYNGRVEEGLEMAVEAIKSNPDSSILYYNLSTIYFYYLRDPQAAYYYVYQAVILDQSDHDSEFYGVSYEEMLKVVEKVLAGEAEIPDIQESVKSLENMETGEHNADTCTDPSHHHHH